MEKNLTIRGIKDAQNNACHPAMGQIIQNIWKHVVDGD